MRCRLLLPLLALSLACTGKFIRPTTDEKVALTPERVKRGEYLVNNAASCGACHTTRESGDINDGESTDKLLGGGNVLHGGGLTVYMPNITPDPETGIGNWTDDEIIRSIRDGVRPDGRFLFPMMPYITYQYLSDEDVRAIVAYLRSIPKVKQTRPRVEAQIPFPINLAIGMGVLMHEPVKSVPEPDRKDKVKYGAYLNAVGHCSGCHSMGSTGLHEPGDPMYMGGSERPMEDDSVGKVWARNLTPDPETGLGNYSAEQIAQALRTGRRLDGKPMASPMSLFMPHLSGLTDEDMDAMVTWLKSLKPVKHAVPPRELNANGKKMVGEG